MSDFDDLPIIQLRPGKTDAELEAERDAQHERDVAEWFAHQEWIRDYCGPVSWQRAIVPMPRLSEHVPWPFRCECELCYSDHIPPQAVQG